LGYTNINGKIIATADAVIAADNGAFRYGIGVFETMLVQNGQIRLGSYHWQRLFAGMKQLYFEVPVLFTAAMLEAEVLRTVKRNNLSAYCRVRLQVYAGGGGIFGEGTQKPLYVIECYSLPEDNVLLNNNGLIVGVATNVTKCTDSLSNLKSANGLVYATAARQAKHNKWNDALVYNTQGYIIESAIANLFWVKEGKVYTPPLTDGCVAGVMRRYIIEQMPDVGERSLTLSELLLADEVMLTNAIKGVRWVSNIDDKRYGCEAIKRIFATLFNHI
jgi:branched-chain amino acid aminotransferase